MLLSAYFQSNKIWFSNTFKITNCGDSSHGVHRTCQQGIISIEGNIFFIYNKDI